jgi:hypothetical protein
VTSESKPEINDQDVRGLNKGEQSSGQVTNEWFPDNFVSFARSPAGSSYPGASLDDQDIPVTSTTRISRGNCSANSTNSRFALIILNQPIEVGLDDFLEIWTRCITQ